MDPEGSAHVRLVIESSSIEQKQSVYGYTRTESSTAEKSKVYTVIIYDLKQGGAKRC